MHHPLFRRPPGVRRARTRLHVLAIAWLAALGSPTGSAAAPPSDVAYTRDVLRELIAIASTHENGTDGAAQALAERFRAAGFPAADIHLLSPPGDAKATNLIVRLRGTGKARPILYLSHLDVVEARREDWSREPFRLIEEDGWLYGRGVYDMKTPVAAVVGALVRMHREGVVPERDIIAAFTADEEAGGPSNGASWLLEQHRDLIDAEFVINPDDPDNAILDGRPRVMGVVTSEKLYVSFEARVTDKGGHSSRPTPGNPIFRLSAGLARLAPLRFPVHLTPTTRLFFQRRSTLEHGDLRDAMAGAAADPPDPAALDFLAASIDTDILLRTTCTATQIDGGHAENALPQQARATIQCRVVPGETVESVQATLARALADPAIELGILTPGAASPESPPSAGLLASIERVSHAIWPEVTVLPEMSPGATDCVYLRRAGVACYVSDGTFIELDDDRAHGRDERIYLTSFIDEVEFTYRMMREFSASPHP